MQTIHLADYYIALGPIQKSLGDFLEKHTYDQLIVLTDQHTRRDCWPLIEQILHVYQPILIEIQPGEEHKTLETCAQIWQRLLQGAVGRKALQINLGGGVIGDMGGFCAGTYKRGIDFVQVPTTLLSQVDASVGGKLGIDFETIKNCIGLFLNPRAVLIDPAFLRTLPWQELRSGFAEVLKHALIADAAHWQVLKKIRALEQADWAGIIPHSLKIKQTIVEADPFEKGLRKALNFGHTIGHAVESWSIQQGQRLLHGEAIAIGMICEAWLSAQIKNLPEAQLQEITQTILQYYGVGITLPEACWPELLALMTQDKKNEGTAINFTLLPEIGSVAVNEHCTTPQIEQSLAYYSEVSRTWPVA